MLRQIFMGVSALLFTVQLAHAEIRVDVTSGNVQPMPIALVDFAGSSIGAQITQVVQADLRSSGLFAPIPSSAFIERTLDVNTAPRFPDWRVVNAQALVVGQASEAGDKVSVDFRLWDVLAEQQMVGRRFTTSRANWRQLAHMVADAIYTRLTGEEGYFNTRVVYVAESGPWNAKVKRLAIMDQDGANNRYLTAGGNLVLTPRFSPNEQQITYMSYERGAPAVYLYDLSSGRHQRIGNFPGMTSAPRFNPKGNSVVMSMSRGGVTNIYSMPLSGGSPRQLTNTRSISTAPSYSPDGARITFESDRSGTQQIYTMNADGSNQTRISFGKGRYASPVWSPRGDLIAFVKMNTGDGQFYIGVMRPDGSGERLISSAYHVEGPTWAPNGRVLMYFKETPSSRGRQAQLYSIDITGANEVRVNTAGAASDPAWGPRLN